jgi:hypothetical protein
MTMIAAIVLIALSTSMPTTNLDSMCQSAKAAALPGQDQASAFQSCVQDEKAARDELQQKWSRFSANARETCAEPKGVTFSYVELLTCLEMQPGSEFNGPQTSPLTPLPAPMSQPKAPAPADHKP